MAGGVYETDMMKGGGGERPVLPFHRLHVTRLTFQLGALKKSMEEGNWLDRTTCATFKNLYSIIGIMMWMKRFVFRYLEV